MLGLPFILFFPLLIADYVVLDRLIRLEYGNWRKEWINDGRPHGFFFVPPESKTFSGVFVSLRSTRALRTIFYEWLFVTPDWMRRQPTARRLLWAHRSLIAILFAPFIALVVLAFLQ
jgi:hypothetical protein